MSDPKFLHRPKKTLLLVFKPPQNAAGAKKSELSGGESNPGLLRVVPSNDKQKY
jgi:hypothetical protein